ncbi:helicase-associated domain-containing protein [Agromyces sp. GXQ0307]|uniref:helicase-associated domain-containing protein n=1 Tax=Agromyces sp. GXQ0307 TaxID=3377835 RepID=UPI00383AD5A7
MLVLAASLRAIPRERLAAALAARELDHSSVRDLFDLAEALTATDSIDHAVDRLERPSLAVLAAAAATSDDAGWTDLDRLADELRRLGSDDLADALVRDPGAVLDRLEARLLLLSDGTRIHVPTEIVARLDSRLDDDLPSLESLAAHAPPVAVPGERPDTGLLDRRAAETAHSTVAATAELLSGLAVQPARELAKGGFALPDAKRLAEAAGVELDEFPRLVRRATEAGLIVRDGPVWLESDAGAEWIMLGTGSRWTRLAEAWRARIPAPLRDLVVRRSEALSSSSIRDDVAWYYPGGGAWLRDGMDRLLEDAEALGLAVGGEPLETAALVLSGDLDGAAERLARHFPQQVDKVYVQHDLTIVSPGPLEPSLDARLRAFAEVEGRDLASSYRVTAASVNRALAAGDSEEGIRAFLEQISLTGIPQPLAYLLSESATRFGAVRVGAADPSEAPARASVRSDDPQLIGTLLVDQSLSSLGLRQDGAHRLLSRFTPDVVFWGLSDARYPVAAEDAEGRIVRLRRHHVGHAPTPAPRTDPLEAMLDRLAEADAEGGTEQAWLARQLEAAARAKETLTVTVRMPGGDTADYLLAPASVANGRLRARDRKSDIERTLPISAIAAVAPAPAGS